MNFSDDSKSFVFNLSKNIFKKSKITYKNAIKILSLSGNCLNDNNSRTKYCSSSGSNFDCDDINLFGNSRADNYFKVENFEVLQVI